MAALETSVFMIKVFLGEADDSLTSGKGIF
jgi:hypothetical protein